MGLRLRDLKQFCLENPGSRISDPCIGNSFNNDNHISYWLSLLGTKNFVPMESQARSYKPSPLKLSGRLPWWSSGKDSACEHRGHRFNPWSGTIPHAIGQSSPCTTATEACVPLSLCSTTREATTVMSPYPTTRESPHVAMRTQHSQKQINFFKQEVMGNYPVSFDMP